MTESSEVSIEDGIKTVTAKVSPQKEVVLRDLNGDELRNLYQLSEDASKTLAFDMPLMALVSINGENLVPVRNADHLRSRAKKFTKSELFKLVGVFSENFNEELEDPKSEIA